MQKNELQLAIKKYEEALNSSGTSDHDKKILEEIKNEIQECS